MDFNLAFWPAWANLFDHFSGLGTESGQGFEGLACTGPLPGGF